MLNNVKNGYFIFGLKFFMRVPMHKYPVRRGSSVNYINQRLLSNLVDNKKIPLLASLVSPFAKQG